MVLSHWGIEMSTGEEQNPGKSSHLRIIMKDLQLAIHVFIYVHFYMVEGYTLISSIRADSHMYNKGNFLCMLSSV
jgi:hypothetical protein